MSKTKEVKAIPKQFRNFPRHTLEEALVIPQKIQDEMGGNPMKRLLLADAVGLSPSSTNFRDLLSSSYKYGLTEGTEKAKDISLTDLGNSTTQSGDPKARKTSIQIAAMTPDIFKKFYENYSDKKLPSEDMLKKILISNYEVPEMYAGECSDTLIKNGEFARIIREISGSSHVLLDTDFPDAPIVSLPSIGDEDKEETNIGTIPENTPSQALIPQQQSNKPIFIGHGKNREPLQQIIKMLSAFQIPHKIALYEANLGRPIPKKIKDIMLECGSAILIFTKDEQYKSIDGEDIWKPSENVIHELGATSFAYEDRVVIFKEKGLNFPSNFSSIGYIEFDPENIEAKYMDLIKELVGFGLIQIRT
jgi:hypothetical protein